MTMIEESSCKTKFSKKWTLSLVCHTSAMSLGHPKHLWSMDQFFQILWVLSTIDALHILQV